MIPAKKAQIGSKMLTYLTAVIILGIAAVGFSIVQAEFQTTKNLVRPGVEKALGNYRFTHTAECFAEQDPDTGRIIPNIIDLGKFHEEQMNKCYLVEPISPHECFNLTLQPLVGDTIIGTVATNNWVHCYLTKRKRELENQYVLIKKGDDLQQGILQTETMS